MVRAWTTWLGSTLVIAIGIAIGAGAQARFTVRSELAILHVAVTDDRGRTVAGLPREAFTVTEDGVTQPITVFSGDDSPATVGLLIDDSTSMVGLRALVTSAAAAFVETSHPADALFALTFNEQVYSVLPSGVPYTNSSAVLHVALQHAITARGRTALYDAVVRGIDEVEQATNPRTALVVVSDGGDNASQHSLADILEALAASNTVVYAVALANPVDPDANVGLLKRLARLSGGLCMTPRDPAQIPDAMVAIARAIRSTYTLAYAVPAGAAGVRHVRVNVRRDGTTLHARTRREYLVR
jgi:VWFA-related protein